MVLEISRGNWYLIIFRRRIFRGWVVIGKVFIFEGFYVVKMYLFLFIENYFF